MQKSPLDQSEINVNEKTSRDQKIGGLFLKIS